MNDCNLFVLKPVTMKKNICLTITFLLVLILTGCQKLFNKPGAVAGLEIQDAVFLGVDPSMNFSEGAVNNLIKVKSGNGLNLCEPGSFFDENLNPLGDHLISAEADGILPASEQYSIIPGDFTFNIKGGEEVHLGLVLNHQTGAIWGLERNYKPEQNYGLQGNYHYQSDADGNIYFVKGGMYRILLNDGSTMQLELYIDGMAQINDQRYLVDQDGNVYFQGGNRVKMNTGGIVETNMDMVVVNGSDGKCYGFRQNRPDEVNILLLGVKDGEFEAAKLSDQGVLFGVAAGEPEAFIGESLNHLHQYKDTELNRSIFIKNTFFAGEDFYPEKSFGNEHCIGFVFDETSYEISPVLIDLPDYFNIMGLEGEYLWVERGKHQYEALKLSSIIVNTASNTAQIQESIVVDIPSEFDISSAMIDQRGFGINVAGFNLSSETRYKGKITVDKGLEYYEEATVPYIMNLTRIN
jgi:hypothetical protein